MAAKGSDSKKKTQTQKGGTGKKTTSKKSGSTSKKTSSQKKTSPQKKAAGARRRSSGAKKSASAKSAPKKTGSASKSGKRGSSRKKGRRFGIKWELGLFLGLLAAVACSAAFYHLYLKPSGQIQKRAAVEKNAPVPQKTIQKPDYEIFPQAPEPVPRPEVSPPPKAAGKQPLVSIIIDDMGYERDMAEKFLSLDCPLTYAILPKSPYQAEIARRAHQRGCQVMLHLPMEPEQYPEANPGPGALLSKMSPNERLRILKENLDTVPYIKGVNNHMGSRMTADSAHMNQILSILKKRGLYFIDSRTTPETRALSSARLFHLPFAERDVFLDHVPEPEFIRAQLRHLVALARQKGNAVGIGHPYPATYQVLAEELPALRDQVQLVPASEVVSVKGS